MQQPTEKPLKVYGYFASYMASELGLLEYNHEHNIVYQPLHFANHVIHQNLELVMVVMVR